MSEAEQQDGGELTAEQLTEAEKSFLQKNRSSAFTPPSNSFSIPALDGAKNWDHWYNSILAMCEMNDIDGIFTGHDPMPVRLEGEKDKALNDRIVYWKTANKYITGSIRFSLKPGGLANIAGVSGAYQMVQRLRSQYKSKGYTSREVLWRTMSRTSLDSCKDMTEWVETIKKAKVSLMELDSSIPQWIVTTTFLHGLPSSYDSFVEIIINARGKDVNGKPLEPEFDDVCERVLDRERRQVLASSQQEFLTTDYTKALTTIAKNNNEIQTKSYAVCEHCKRKHPPPCYHKHPELAPSTWIRHDTASTSTK